MNAVKIIVGITGASGIIYGIKILQHLQKRSIETHVVLSEWAKQTLEIEKLISLEEVEKLAHKVYDANDLAAPISSGSFLHDGMIVAPCSMKTLAGIRHGFSQNLIQRAADVTMKERRKLILMPRESPFNTIHLENMLGLSQMGVIIAPPCPSFYHKPQTLEEMVNFSAMRILDLLGIHEKSDKRWREAYE